MKNLSLLTIIVFAGLLTLFAAPTANAQDMKVGFVEPRAILDRMPEMRAVAQRLQNFAERKERELIAKQQELQSEFEIFQQRAGVISDQAREAEEQRIAVLDQEFREMQSAAEQEMQEQRQTLMAPLLQQIQESINNVAESRGLDYVLNTTTSTGDVIILYVSQQVQDEYDITDAVMADLGI